MSKGIIQIYTGDGRGKTPAAIGKAVQAAAEGANVVIIQFLKGKGLQESEFLKKLEDMIEFLIPNYIAEGKNQLVIGIGCTGGKHRSVTVANAIYEKLSEDKDIGIKVTHRDIAL